MHDRAATRRELARERAIERERSDETEREHPLEIGVAAIDERAALEARRRRDEEIEATSRGSFGIEHAGGQCLALARVHEIGRDAAERGDVRGLVLQRLVQRHRRVAGAMMMDPQAIAGARQARRDGATEANGGTRDERDRSVVGRVALHARMLAALAMPHRIGRVDTAGAAGQAESTLETASVRHVGKALTLRDMTQASGCTPRTVRYYERQGLLRAARSAGGHRLFARVELERLQFIISLREAGWSLEEVEALLSVRDAAESDRGACSRLDAMLADHVARLEKKIEILTRLRDDLTGTQSLLAVCTECTETRPSVDCEACDRMPPVDRLPRGFRLAWRARTGTPFDEHDADGAEESDAPTDL
jgi:DNA-binding transcriptional MerR regulator